MIVAHRGASRDAPENTLPAFRLAWEQGADAIEGDFHQTKDGKIVCIHDEETARVASMNLVVSKSTLEELRKLDVGAYRGKGFTGSAIPTIAEVFATIPEKKKIFIEIRCDESIIPNLVNEIEESGLQREQVVVISFRAEVIHALKTRAPQYKALWLCGLNEDRFGELTPSLKTILETLRQIKADGLSSSDNVNESFVKCIMGEGYEYHVWTVDEVKTARRFEGWGASSITTNIPGYIKKKLVA